MNNRFTRDTLCWAGLGLIIAAGWLVWPPLGMAMAGVACLLFGFGLHAHAVKQKETDDTY